MPVATRILRLRNADADTEIGIKIFAPENTSNGAWSCRYEIDWPDGKWSMTAWSTDSVQAMFLAMQMIGSEIYTSNYHKSGRLFVEAPGRGYRFPVPQSLRGLLEGDDAIYL